MNNSTDEQDDDAFSPIFDSGFNRAVFVLAWLTTQTLGNFLVLTIHKQVDGGMYKTLIDQLGCQLLVYSFLYNLIPFNISFLRSLAGPLPTFLCQIQVSQRLLNSSG
jgi:hypothetical protein